MERYLFNQPNLEELKFHLNRLNILNRFKTEFEPRRPALCRPGPPRLPLSLPHPAADHRTPLPPGPICQSRSAASPANRRSPLSAQQRRRSCLTTEGRCRPRLSPRAVDRHAPSSPYLSCFLSSAWHTRADPPPLPLSFSPARPPIWRSRWLLTLLRSVPELELLSFSTAYASTSLAPATGDPYSSLVPARAPPSFAIIGEHDHALSLRSNGLTPHLFPPSPTLQGHTVDIIHHRSSLPVDERCRPKHPPPPLRRAAARVSSTPDSLARRPPCGPASSPVSPCRRPATTEPPVSAPLRHRVREVHAVAALRARSTHAICSRAIGRVSVGLGR
jgi:hypothetical protein